MSKEYHHRKYVARRGELRGLRGRPPDLAKRAKVHALRAAGLTLVEIGLKLGVTPQAVSLMARKPLPDAAEPKGKPKT
jgi:hypothetical protein